MDFLNSSKKLKKNFYIRDTLLIAKKLLGKIFVKNDGKNLLAGRIVEVEAYHGKDDLAAHSYIGKTERNKIMFEEGGYLYVYFTYGVHFCCNVVTEKEGIGSAVLIRAIEPIHGIDIMATNRFGKKLINEKEKYNLTSGPGKICKAFNITKEHYGIDLTGNKIYLLSNRNISNDKIVAAKRVGIKKSINLMWRFYIKDNPYVSKK